MDYEERIAKLEAQVAKLRRVTTLQSIALILVAISIIFQGFVVHDRVNQLFELIQVLSSG